MLKHRILLFLGFLGFLALTSATFTPEKNFFFLPYFNGLSTEIFQTRNGTIAYSVDLMDNGQYAPHYVQINTQTNSVTPILQDLVTACGQGASAFNRLQYHVLTYSFVYYCTNNNSILVLNGRNYEVQTVVSLSITETFDEVRIITEGYSVAIIGLSGLFTQNPGPSHLIKYSLQTQTVVNHVVFDHGFAAGEVVTAYGSNGNFFIITNIINSSINIANVYGMTLIGNSYSLTHLATFNSTSSFPSTLPEFYVNKNLIFTSNEDSLVILDQNGNVQRVQGGVALNEFPGSGTTSTFRPVIVSFPGTGAIHVLLRNTTLLQFSVQNQGFSVQDEGTASSISLAIQDQLTDNLLYSFGGETEDFRITNLDSGKVVYESVANFTNFMITDKTYSAISKLNNLYIFDIQTNALIQTIAVNNNSYYDQKSSTFSSLSLNNNNYTFQQIDLRTGNVYTPLSFSFLGAGPVELVHATNNENFDSPELILYLGDSETHEDIYLIVSKTFGQVKFVVNVDAPHGHATSLAVDYDTLTAFYYYQSLDSNEASITEYNYVSSNNSFVRIKGNEYPVAEFLTDGSYIILATDYSVIATPGKVEVIDMSTLNEKDYSFNTQWTCGSAFQNTTNGFNMVLSQEQQWGAQVSPNLSAGIFYQGVIEPLPGTTSTTVQAGTAGSCSYWVVNQVGAFGVVTFYNICDNDNILSIIA